MRPIVTIPLNHHITCCHWAMEMAMQPCNANVEMIQNETKRAWACNSRKEDVAVGIKDSIGRMDDGS